MLKRFDTPLNDPTKQDSIKVPKAVEPIVRKRHYKTLETSVINSPMSPSYLSRNSGVHRDSLGGCEARGGLKKV